MFARIEGDRIDATDSRRPRSARRLDNGEWVLLQHDTPVEVAEACGWFEVTDTPKPPDTATATHDRTVQVVDGVPVVVWVERPWTSEELGEHNADTIRQRALAALDSNRAFIAAPSPTAAQTLAQVRSMARQMNGIIRLVLGALDSTD